MHRYGRSLHKRLFRVTPIRSENKSLKLQVRLQDDMIDRLIGDVREAVKANDEAQKEIERLQQYEAFCAERGNDERLEDVSVGDAISAADQAERHLQSGALLPWPHVHMVILRKELDRYRARVEILEGPKTGDAGLPPRRISCEVFDGCIFTKIPLSEAENVAKNCDWVLQSDGQLPIYCHYLVAVHRALQDARKRISELEDPAPTEDDVISDEDRQAYDALVRRLIAHQRSSQ